MKPGFVGKRASALQRRFTRVAAVSLALLGGLAAVNLALPADAQRALPTVATQSQSVTQEELFNGSDLYKAAFKQIRDRHLDLRDPVRAAWVASQLDTEAALPIMPHLSPEKCVGTPYTESQLPQTLCGINASNVFKNVIKPSLVIVRISPQYAGSGFVVTSKSGACLVVTANHVVGVRQFATLTLPTATGYTQMRAEVVQRDSGLDLAALRIPSSANYQCQGINLAVHLPTPGENVLAAGFPLSMQEPIITPGTVIGANQKLDPKDLLNGENASNLFVVTEQLIYPGNSGGLLTSITGAVYGLTNHSNVKDRSWSVESIHIRQFLRTITGWENF